MSVYVNVFKILQSGYHSWIEARYSFMESSCSTRDFSYSFCYLGLYLRLPMKAKSCILTTSTLTPTIVIVDEAVSIKDYSLLRSDSIRDRCSWSMSGLLARTAALNSFLSAKPLKRNFWNLFWLPLSAVLLCLKFPWFFSKLLILTKGLNVPFCPRECKVSRKI